MGAKLENFPGAICAAVSHAGNGALESERSPMSQESTNPTLERLTEETAEAIRFTIGATTSDPKQAVIQLLLSYLQRAHEQTHQKTLVERHREERDQ
jgi:hypothetical protein